MGIYPDTETSKQGDILVTTYNDYSGVVITTYYQPILVVENRDNCFCCSCSETEYGQEVTDPYCRNHGYAGMRPCEKHDMPGQEDDEGVMPVSVQIKRRQDSKKESRK